MDRWLQKQGITQARELSQLCKCTPLTMHTQRFPAGHLAGFLWSIHRKRLIAAKTQGWASPLRHQDRVQDPSYHLRRGPSIP